MDEKIRLVLKIYLLMKHESAKTGKHGNEVMMQECSK
jgi:hypothetical protein